MSTTLILTADAQDWTTDTGFARTGHGVLVPTIEARRWASGDTRVIGVALDRFDAVASFTDRTRIFSQNQRLAMVARDKGCSLVAATRRRSTAKPTTSSSTPTADPPRSVGGASFIYPLANLNVVGD